MDKDRLLQNALITVRTACRARAGETLLLITEERNKAPFNDDLGPVNRALVDACRALGVHPVLMDIGSYIRSGAFAEGHVNRVVSEAIGAADVVLNLADYIPYSRLAGMGSTEEGAWLSDRFVTGEDRLFALQSHGMDRWDISDEQVALITRRSRWLVDLVRRSEHLTVSGAAGTRFSCGLGDTSNVLPFLCLVPLFGEVPVIPAQGTEEGVLVVDGPTQRGVRRPDELDREPLRIIIEKGKVVSYDGDPVQTDRFRKFMEAGDPRADNIDEVGILTTAIPENDRYWWEDGTHHHDRTHIAVGNNILRSENVHGKAHMDCEICRPTVTVDGLTVVSDGVFDDNLLTEK